MKTLWITLCKNEMDILPFVSKYWERIKADVLVFDNGSDDGSIEYLSKLPYVTLRHFDSDGQNDVIQKQVKEQAYLEFKNKYDIIIISDMDEVFYWRDFEASAERFLSEGYNIQVTPIYSLCEDLKPQPDDSKLLHQLCTKFYKQKMNHMQGFEEYSKLSIFNCKITDKVEMSVGQHYVRTLPDMKISLELDAFCLHIDKGFGYQYRYDVKQKMWKNLSETNKRGGMCLEYNDSFEMVKKEYEQHQAHSFNLNEILNKMVIIKNA